MARSSSNKSSWTGLVTIVGTEVPVFTEPEVGAAVKPDWVGEPRRNARSALPDGLASGVRAAVSGTRRRPERDPTFVLADGLASELPLSIPRARRRSHVRRLIPSLSQGLVLERQC